MFYYVLLVKATYLQNKEVPWDDMVNVSRLDAEISADVTEWSKYVARKYVSRRTNKPDETADYLVETLYSYVRFVHPYLWSTI